jgi:hypothetical protein
MHHLYIFAANVIKGFKKTETKISSSTKPYIFDARPSMYHMQMKRLQHHPFYALSDVFDHHDWTGKPLLLSCFHPCPA